MNNEELQQLKALAQAATPGPWSECGNARGGCSCGQVWSTSADMPIATAERGDEEIGPIAPEVYKANAKYIASASPDVVLALIAKVESLAADAERLNLLDQNLKYNMHWRIGRAPAGNLSIQSVICMHSQVPIRAAIDAFVAKEKA